MKREKLQKRMKQFQTTQKKTKGDKEWMINNLAIVNGIYKYSSLKSSELGTKERQ